MVSFRPKIAVMYRSEGDSARDRPDFSRPMDCSIGPPVDTTSLKWRLCTEKVSLCGPPELNVGTD